MTYCVAVRVDQGLVMLSDTRTNAGMDNIARFRKSFTYHVPGERAITLLCSGNLSITQGVKSLLSKAIKLVAAFDHRHIFLDPDPDPAASWKERKRLFDLPRSSWEDYDSALISKGGGVFARDAKSIKLSKAMQAKLGIEQAQIEPEALISAILRAPIDLIWFGGIGTYIKASHENNVQVGDPANDALRVDGKEGRAKVIGEGANLGITQVGRIEFAMAGGRSNTDFIDNSAGVDCSDNEVNIKIALAAAKRSGKLSEPKRVALLESMTDEVAEIVLEDNRLQALALSIAEQGGAGAQPQVGGEATWMSDGDMVRQAYTLREDDDDWSQAGALVREVMDDVQFMPPPAAGGNLLRMIKKLPKGPDNET